MAAPALPDGLVAVVKKECETCVMVEPVLAQLAGAGPLTVYTQDDVGFPSTVAPIDDTDLSVSYHLGIDTVPTLIRVDGGVEVGRTFGWSRPDWEGLSGVDGLGEGLPAARPGCGSRSVDPMLVDALRVRFEGSILHSRRVELAALEDEFEALYQREWSDGLPLVPPTEARVLRMLEGTSRDPQEVVAVVPPHLAPATVEKVAINAVMAGCRPEYLPVVLAAVEGACTEAFNIHGLLCTTYFSGPILVVNGPIARRIGMNSGPNVLGQGNRANLTIGRALQLVVRNVGGGRPGVGGIDRAAFGAPSKLGMAFAENEEASPWEPLSVERGFPAGISTVTLFAGHGPSAAVDQLSRNPESLARSLAGRLVATNNPKLFGGLDVMLVVGPEHARVFADAGWSKQRIREELVELTTRDGADLVRGAGGIDEGMPAHFASRRLAKFEPEAITIVHAGGEAGLFSAILESWVRGPVGSQITTVPITD
jgi:hypothetical protein